MSFLDGVSDYFLTKEQKMRADAMLTENYARTGVQIFEILNKLKRPYLDIVENFSEVANLLYMSTYKQFVYSLKLNRPMSDEEVRTLSNTLRREMSKMYNMKVEEFNKKWNFKIVGNNVFFVIV